MSANILIGVGGTGAKVVESMLHAASAGLGPESLTVGFVDQDQSNGNVTRALELLGTSTQLRQLWRGENSPHRLSRATPLLRSDIRSLAPGNEVWVPHPEQKTTLATIFGEATMEPGERHLFDLLFAGGETEQDLPLDIGYHGRPNIGSAAMTARVEEDVEFWRALIQRVEQAQAGQDVRLLLAGSVFGGTGAAGFPTLARLIRARLRQRNVTRNVHIGGVLMLPYFGFERPPSDDGLEGNVARREELLAQSQGALKYYYHLFQQEHVFDELYLVGWNRSFELGYHKPGSAEQANPPLVPEMFGALAAGQFFSKPLSAESVNKVFVSARGDDRALNWSDLPSPAAAQLDAPFDRFGQMLRFSVGWLYWRTLLAERQGLAKLFTRAPWYRLQGLDKVDFRNSPPETETQKLSQYARSFLWWAACQEHYCPSAGTEFNLWRTDSVIGAVQRDNPTDPFEIVAALDEHKFGEAYDRILVNKASADPLPSANNLIDQLNNGRGGSDDSRGLGSFVSSLAAFSSTRGAAHADL